MFDRAPRVAVAMLAVLVFAGCTSDRSGPGSGSSAGMAGGGVLHVMLVSQPGANTFLWDPMYGYASPTAEALRCCLLRTLFSYQGLPAERGGTVVRPDLATGMPDVSSDGLTWTITLKQGLHYAPPYADREIVAPDVVEAVERIAGFGLDAWGVQYFRPIVGFDEFVAHRAHRIAGLRTPDDHTLVVRLRAPLGGDLPDRFALSATAPIPPGAARAHRDDYIRYMISSGPYMVEGAEALTPWRPPEQQVPAAGFTLHRVTLVRNPSWDPSTDDLRLALPDEIRFEVFVIRAREDSWGQAVREARRRLVTGRLDVIPYADPSIHRVARGEGPGKLVTGRSLSLMYIPLNLAVPPFDDVHVRKAVNLVVDRVVIGQVLAGSAPSIPSFHLIPSSLEGGRIDDGWRPSWAPGAAPDGDIAAARAEMRRSRYDTDGDGRCDGRRCVVKAVAADLHVMNRRRIVSALERLGITPRIAVQGDVSPYGGTADAAGRPGLRFGLMFETGWMADFANASSFFVPLLYGTSITAHGNGNVSLLGASRSELRRWGYAVSSVPSADLRIERCLSLIGETQMDCWTRLDQYLMEEVVPWVPVAMLDDTSVVSDRVLRASYDESRGSVAFDRVLLAPAT